FTTGSLFIYTAELSPTRMRAWATATGSSVNRMVGFIAPTIVGALLATQFGIGGVFGLLLVTSLIGFVTMKLFGIETRQRVLEEVVPPERLSGTIVAKPAGMPGQLQTAAHLALDAIDPRATRMRYVLDIGITGKLGSIGQSAFRAKAEELAAVFGSNVKSAIE